MSREEQLARLMECWSTLELEFSQAMRWRDYRRLRGLATALKIVDACIAIEADEFAQRNHFGEIIANPDRQVMVRLREIARVRDVLKGVMLAEEGAATSDEVADGPAEPEVAT